MKKLFTVIRQGKLDEVKNIIEKKPELVNCVAGPLPKKDHGQSPLQVALKTGNYEIAGYLIEHGADVDFMEAEDDDPGLRAPVLFDAINSTIISLCYQKFEESDIAFEYVKLLVEKGADVNKLASNGLDALSWTVHKAGYLMENAGVYPHSQEAVRKQFEKILDCLIEHGADYVAWANRGYYPEPHTEPSNRSLFIDAPVPDVEPEIERCKAVRAFLQEYFHNRKLQF
ncbi:MAG: ankyrin repeat domain-containing protein [Lachnospiraceae bacterium]